MPALSSRRLQEDLAAIEAEELVLRNLSAFKVRSGCWMSLYVVLLCGVVPGSLFPSARCMVLHHRHDTFRSRILKWLVGLHDMT